jgi:hypothetical protein
VRAGGLKGVLLGPPSGGVGGRSPSREGSRAAASKQNFTPRRQHIYRDDIFLGPHDI